MGKQERQWEEVDETTLTIAERCVYRIRRRALELYLGGVNAKDIFRATGLSHTAVMRLWNRCCEPAVCESFGTCRRREGN